MENQGVTVRRGPLARVVDPDVDAGGLERDRGQEAHGAGAHHDHFGFPLAEHRVSSDERGGLPATLPPE